MTRYALCLALIFMVAGAGNVDAFSAGPVPLAPLVAPLPIGIPYGLPGVPGVAPPVGFYVYPNARVPYPYTTSPVYPKR
jgi:hypothetical protein